MNEELMLKTIVESGKGLLLFEVAERLMGTEDLLNLTLPFWNENDREEVIKETYKLIKE